MKVIEVKIPGKVMLSGEYAVLAGRPALATTVDRFLKVTMEAGEPGQPTVISSDIWPEDRVWDPDSDDLLQQAVTREAKATGVVPGRIRVQSELDIKHGLGTSSALRLGIAMAMRSLAAGRIEADVWRAAATAAYEMQRQAQTSASGYDVITQELGGTICLYPTEDWPGRVEHFESAHELGQHLRLVAGGAGAPTTQVMRQTLSWLANQEAALVAISNRLTDAILAALAGGLWQDVYQAVGEHRRFFAAAPTQPRALLQDLESLPGCDETWSIKTTGAGGEDSLLLFGLERDVAAAKDLLATKGWGILPVSFSNVGGEAVWH